MVPSKVEEMAMEAEQQNTHNAVKERKKYKREVGEKIFIDFLN